MGWDFCDNWNTIEAVEQATIREINNSGYTVIAHARTRGCMWFSIEKNGVRFIELALVQKDGKRYGTKRISEHEHPYYYDIPAKVFNTVKDRAPVNESSKVWREHVCARMSK